MTSETTKLRAKLSILSASLDELEAELQPLFSQPLPETLVALDTIQQAKLQTLLPYLLYDLVFIYLKTRGIEPKTHGVISELDRVRQYFEKIAKAEETPEQKRTAVDKDAAGRFIKHAIAQAKTTTAEPLTPSGTTNNASEPQAKQTITTKVPVRMTAKMVARAQYEKELKKLDTRDSEDHDIAVFDENDKDADDDGRTSLEETPKGKAKEDNSVVSNESTQHIRAPSSNAGGKRRRPQIDPFTGYDDEPSPTPPPSPSKKKSRKPNPPQEATPQPHNQEARDVSDPNPAVPTPSLFDEAKAAKKARKKAKKAEMLASTG